MEKATEQEKEWHNEESHIARSGTMKKATEQKKEPWKKPHRARKKMAQ
jgi:hypothetical protein